VHPTSISSGSDIVATCCFISFSGEFNFSLTSSGSGIFTSFNAFFLFPLTALVSFCLFLYAMSGNRMKIKAMTPTYRYDHEIRGVDSTRLTLTSDFAT